MTLTHVDLFSGIGGLALAARWAGFQTTLFCEIDPYCRRVLRRHWPEVPQHDDVRTLDGKAFRGATLLTGGFPCQPFSAAGKRKGKADDRHLWPEMFRVIRESRPAWIVGENVAGFISLALDDVLSDLEGEGYACRAFLVPACGVGAPHRRERCFVVAHATSGRRADHAERFRLVSAESPPQPGRWHQRMAPPRLQRMVDGLSSQLDRNRRLKALGNAVVPQQVYPFLQAIAEIETAIPLTAEAA